MSKDKTAQSLIVVVLDIMSLSLGNIQKIMIIKKPTINQYSRLKTNLIE